MGHEASDAQVVGVGHLGDGFAVTTLGKDHAGKLLVLLLRPRPPLDPFQRSRVFDLIDHFLGQLRVTSLVPHEHFVHGHVQFRREVLGVGQGDLWMGVGSGKCAPNRGKHTVCLCQPLDSLCEFAPLLYATQESRQLKLVWDFYPFSDERQNKPHGVNLTQPPVWTGVALCSRRLPQVGQADKAVSVGGHRGLADDDLGGLDLTLSRQTLTPSSERDRRQSRASARAATALPGQSATWYTVLPSPLARHGP